MCSIAVIRIKCCKSKPTDLKVNTRKTQFLHARADVVGAIDQFPAEKQGLQHGGADCHPDSFTLSYKPLQGPLEFSV